MIVDKWIIPSGKHLHNYRKSPLFMGKSTINDINGPFSIAFCMFTGGEWLRFTLINVVLADLDAPRVTWLRG